MYDIKIVVIVEEGLKAGHILEEKTYKQIWHPRG